MTFCLASFPRSFLVLFLPLSVCLSFYRGFDVISCLTHAYCLQCVLSDQPHGGSWGAHTLLQVGSGKGKNPRCCCFLLLLSCLEEMFVAFRVKHFWCCDEVRWWWVSPAKLERAFPARHARIKCSSRDGAPLFFAHRYPLATWI